MQGEVRLLLSILKPTRTTTVNVLYHTLSGLHGENASIEHGQLVLLRQLPVRPLTLWPPGHGNDAFCATDVDDGSASLSVEPGNGCLHRANRS